MIPYGYSLVIVNMMPIGSNYHDICQTVSKTEFHTSIVADSEVAAVGPLRSKAEEELVSCQWFINIDCTHCLDQLSETQKLSLTPHFMVEFNKSRIEKDWKD